MKDSRHPLGLLAYATPLLLLPACATDQDSYSMVGAAGGVPAGTAARSAANPTPADAGGSSGGAGGPATAAGSPSAGTAGVAGATPTPAVAGSAGSSGAPPSPGGSSGTGISGNGGVAPSPAAGSSGAGVSGNGGVPFAAAGSSGAGISGNGGVVPTAGSSGAAAGGDTPVVELVAAQALELSGNVATLSPQNPECPGARDAHFALIFSADGAEVTLKELSADPPDPMHGPRVASSADRARYALYDTWTGGELTVWLEGGELVAEVAPFGSGLPVLDCTRGPLTPTSCEVAGPAAPPLCSSECSSPCACSACEGEYRWARPDHVCVGACMLAE